jgi:hypothetical protein
LTERAANAQFTKSTIIYQIAFIIRIFLRRKSIHGRQLPNDLPLNCLPKVNLHQHLISITMTEEGGGAPGGQGNSQTAGEHVNGGEKNAPAPKPVESRKSTWAVSSFDIHASGMATPLGTHSRRSSGIDLDEYFV